MLQFLVLFDKEISATCIPENKYTPIIGLQGINGWGLLHSMREPIKLGTLQYDKSSHDKIAIQHESLMKQTERHCKIRKTKIL